MRKTGAESASSGSVSREGMVVGSTGDEVKGVGEYVNDSGSILSLQPWIFRKGAYQVDRENMVANRDFSGLDGFGLDNSTTGSQVLSPRSVRLDCGFGKRRSSIRSRRSRYSVLPMDSQNCLIPQLYGENFEIEEFVFSPVSPPSLPSRRPFYVTNGSQVISKSSYEQVGPFIGNEPGKKSNGVKARGTMAGFSGLPESRKVKRKSPRIHQEMEDSANRKQVLGSLIVISPSSTCNKLHSTSKASDSLFFKCPISSDLWFRLDMPWLRRASAEKFWSLMVLNCCHAYDGCLCPFVILWVIWLSRNGNVSR